MPDDSDGQAAQLVKLGIRQCLRRSHHDTLAGMDSERIEVFHITHRNAIVVGVTYDFIFDFFPALQRFFDQQLRRISKRFFGEHFQFGRIIAESRSHPAERISRPHDDGVPQSFGRFQGIIERFDRHAPDRFHPYFIELFHEEFAVFRIHNRLHGRTKHLHAIFFEYSRSVQPDPTVERRLSSESQQDAFGTFLGNDLLHEIRRDGQEVNFIGRFFRCLHRRDIRVNQNGFHPLLAQSFQCLRTGIIKLAGFAYLQCARSEDERFFYIFLHFCV